MQSDCASGNCELKLYDFAYSAVEYVEQWPHLGHVISSDLDDKHDISVEFYLYPTVGTVLIHSAKPELTE